LKLSIIRKNGAISGYSIAFNKSEVEAAGLVDADRGDLVEGAQALEDR